MKRVIVSIGDIFEIQVSENEVMYMQFIAVDHLQLDGHVMRVFKARWPQDASPDAASILSDAVYFHAHTYAQVGVKLGCWVKKFAKQSVSDLSTVVFRHSLDYGAIGFVPGAVSERWYIWKIGDKTTTYVGQIGNYTKAEIGSVFPPQEIVNRAKTGICGFLVPSF